MSRATRRRNQPKPQAPADGNLLDAKNRLDNAIATLTAPQPRHTDTGTHWLPNRYNTLRQALYSGRDQPGGTGPHSIPAWIDALKLLIQIDAAAHTWQHTWPPDRCEISDRHEHPTIRHIRQIPTHPWRPQDTRNLLDITTQLASYAQAVDDLFAPKPVYLPDACPRCGFDHAYQLTDDGQRIRRPALALTVERGCICQNCHDSWTPDLLPHLARLLGYQRLPGVLETEGATR